MGAFVLTPLKYFYPPALCKATVVPEASYPYTGVETQRFNVILAHTHPYPSHLTTPRKTSNDLTMIMPFHGTDDYLNARVVTSLKQMKGKLNS